MHPKKAIDFKRGLKALATDQGWLIDVFSESGRPTERIVVVYKEGYETARIASFILKQDEKEINPAIARKIVRNIRLLINADNGSQGVVTLTA